MRGADIMQESLCLPSDGWRTVEEKLIPMLAFRDVYSPH